MKSRIKLRRVISSETKQIEIYLKNEDRGGEKCGHCRELSPMFSPEVIAEIFPVSKREIYRHIEADRIHFKEFGEREIFVCLLTLMRISDAEQFQIEGFIQ